MQQLGESISNKTKKSEVERFFKVGRKSIRPNPELVNQ